MQEKLAATSKLMLALVLSVLVSGTPVTSAFALTGTSDNETQQITVAQEVDAKPDADTQKKHKEEVVSAKTDTPNKELDTEPAGETTVVPKTTEELKPHEEPKNDDKPKKCVDAKNAQNIEYKWLPDAVDGDENGESYNHIAVSLKGNLPACEDTEIYLSSYVMPDTWDGNGFNESAAPQSVFDSMSVTFEANQHIPRIELRTNDHGHQPVVHTLKVDMPDECTNVQTELYYGPEIKTVEYPQGHGSQNIVAKLKHKLDTCEVPTDVCPNLDGAQESVPEGYVKVDDGTCIKPGMGGGTPNPETPVTETPATPVTPEVLGASTTAQADTELPETLPATGASATTNPLYMILASLAAYGIVYFAGQRRSLNKTNV